MKKTMISDTFVDNVSSKVEETTGKTIEVESKTPEIKLISGTCSNENCDACQDSTSCQNNEGCEFSINTNCTSRQKFVNGRSCTDNYQCASDMCDQGICTATCNEDSDCSTSYIFYCHYYIMVCIQRRVFIFQGLTFLYYPRVSCTYN